MVVGQRKHLLQALLSYLLMVAIAFVTVGPFLLMISISLRPNYISLVLPISLIPESVSLVNYQVVLSSTKMSRWLVNSIAITLTVTLLQLFTSSLGGYAFARGRFPGRDLIFWVFMGTLMIPGTVAIVPLFLLMSAFGWVNSYNSLIIPFATSIFGTFLLRQFIQTIPSDYDDAALIDGASRFGIYRRIVIPLCKPALATLAILTFLEHWNDFLYPLIMIQSADMMTLPIGLATMVVQRGNAGVQMASAATVFLPTLLVFLAAQRYIIAGIALSGVKG